MLSYISTKIFRGRKHSRMCKNLCIYACFHPFICDHLLVWICKLLLVCACVYIFVYLQQSFESLYAFACLSAYAPKAKHTCKHTYIQYMDLKWKYIHIHERAYKQDIYGVNTQSAKTTEKALVKGHPVDEN